MRRRRHLLALPALALSLLGSPAAAGHASSSAPPVFVDVAAARTLIKRQAQVLDARGSLPATARFLPGAVRTHWHSVRAGLLRVGQLTSAPRARAHYAAKGVDVGRPVLVYGAAGRGWGEEGRVWWDLAYLGHPEVYILDGGVEAWLEAEGPTQPGPSQPQPGAFPSLTPRSDLRADHDQVLKAENGVLLDARTYEEYWGATPYFSSRGGHIPKARTLHWRRLLDARGRLRSEPELRRLFVSLGLGPGSSPVAYCTGGVRSAFVVAVLRHLGWPARNYDGSWWDWSSRAELPVR